MIRGINWWLLGAAAVLPPVVAAPASLFFWRKGWTLFGNATGLSVIFVACLCFGCMEYVEAVRYRYGCEAAALPCPPSHPSDFVRLSLFAYLAMFQAMLLFIVSATVERRLKQRETEPMWRR
jgi:hypothetical protein